jgi:hypothetical protein
MLVEARYFPAIVLLLICAVVALGCGDSRKHVDFNREQPMETNCDQIVTNCSLAVELDDSSEPPRAYVRFSNNSRARVWFPASPEPAFRPEEEHKSLKIWFGYSEEVHGKYAGRYMIPPMRLVPPGEDCRVELTFPALVQKFLERRLAPSLEARVSTIELRQTRTRGEQPLDEYLQHSCIIQSAGAVKKESP